MKQSLFTAAAVVASLALAGAALAQPAGGGGARAACQADLLKLCPDAKPGPGGGMRECVQSNWDHLSDPCKAAITQMRAARQAGGGGKPQ